MRGDSQAAPYPPSMERKLLTFIVFPFGKLFCGGGSGGFTSFLSFRRAHFVVGVKF